MALSDNARRLLLMASASSQNSFLIYQIGSGDDAEFRVELFGDMYRGEAGSVVSRETFLEYSEAAQELRRERLAGELSYGNIRGVYELTPLGLRMVERLRSNDA